VEYRRILGGTRLPDKKPRVAVYKFTGCAGCQMELLRLEEELLDLAAEIEIVYFMMAKTEVDLGPYDICFVEGSVSTPRELEELKILRSVSRVLVAFGDCAVAGCVPSIRNWMKQAEAEAIVYEDRKKILSFRVRGLDEFVPVDVVLPGCPPDRKLILRTVISALQGIAPRIDSFPVCVECKMKENECLLKLGKACMGPVTRAGCGAICPSFGRECEGCYGPMSDANAKQLATVFMEDLGLSKEDVLRKFRKYAGMTDEFRREAGL